MIPKLLKHFKLKPNSYQRDCIDIWQTNECNVIPFISVTNIMCKGNTYVRFGWLFWYLEYFKDGFILTGCNGEEILPVGTFDMVNDENPN